MKAFTLHSTTGNAVRHLFLMAFSAAVVLLITSGMSDAQPAGSQTPKLIGTVEGGGFVGAVISDAKGEQNFYRLKEKLPDGSQIVKVRPDSILLMGADGTSYDMYIAHETSAAAPPANPAVSANPRRPEVLPYAPLERIPNSHGKRRQREGSADQE